MGKFRSTLTRLMWTVIFAALGGGLLSQAWPAIQANSVSRSMAIVAIGGTVLLVFAAYALVATFLALLELASPDVKAMVDRPIGAAPLPPTKQAKMVLPFFLAVLSFVSYAMAVRLYLEPTTDRPGSYRNPLLIVIQPIYDRFGSSGLLIFYLVLGSVCLLFLLWRLRRAPDQ